MADSALAGLLHRGDHGELLREVERRCSAGDWDGLLVLRDRCQEAAETLGKQLWPVAHYAEYRVALEAPGPVAASVLRPGAARFALGPLTEVAASTHTWAELADHIDLPVIAATVAQERVVRGEDLRSDPRAAPDEFELPLHLQPYEPSYPVPTYRIDEVLEGGPADPAGIPRPVSARPGPPRDHTELERALRTVVAAWTERSSGSCATAAVAGDAAAAVAALVPAGARITPLTVAEAFARVAWAGASGGVHARRRGMAAGRSEAFWVAHAATGLDFPAPPETLGGALQRLGWYAFDSGSQPPGWSLRLAVADEAGGWAVAVDARDSEHGPEPLG